ncbi:MAG TPA: chemotaxis protein CheW [Myxococcota bacterium]|nr:chemotaxis protein CheW [Myxococcota bacterium]
MPPSVRVRTETLDRFLSAVGEVILASSQLRTVASAGPAQDAGFAGGLDRMDRVVGELQRRALDLRTAPLLRVVETLPRLAREIAQRGGKQVEVELRGVELELDRAILDRLGDPLVHLLRNAVDHGLEIPEVRRAAGKPDAGRVVIDARREKDQVRITVVDDGGGIDLDAVRAKAIEGGLLLPALAEDLPPEEIASLVFRPGLSTASEVSDVSGRGVGMDAVRATIEALGGRVELETDRGRGTATTLIVPITAAVQRVLLIGLGAETVAVPIAKIERIFEVEAAQVERTGHDAFTLVDDEPVLVVDLAAKLGLPTAPGGARVTLALGEVRGERVAFIVERLAGQQEIYVKPVSRLLAGVRALAGLTVLGDGSPVFLLDLNQLP